MPRVLAPLACDHLGKADVSIRFKIRASQRSNRQPSPAPAVRWGGGARRPSLSRAIYRQRSGNKSARRRRSLLRSPAPLALMRVGCFLLSLLLHEAPTRSLRSAAFLFAFFKHKAEGPDDASYRRHASAPVEDQVKQPTMVEETEPAAAGGDAAGSAEHWLSRARFLVPDALKKARSAKWFAGRWKSIAAKLERLPPCLSDLSGHPCFARHALCRELLQSVAATLSETVELADRCREGDGAASIGKLQMQSDIDALSGKLDLNLRDFGLLVKTGVLGEAALPPAAASRPSDSKSTGSNICELLARLQIGHAEAKHRALDGLLEAIREDEKSVMAVLSRSNISALIQLLTAATPKVKEKVSIAICSLTEAGNLEKLLVMEGVLPPLIRLLDSGTIVAREKAVISLQRLSMFTDSARLMAGQGGIRPLIELCQTGDSISQSAAAGALKNLSAVPEVRQTLVDEGIVRVLINLLDCGTVLGTREYAAECLQHLTSSNESLRRSVVLEGGIRSILSYLDGPLPQEPAVVALKNLIGSVSMDSLISLGLLPRLLHVLRDGSLGAQQAAAATICKLSSSAEAKRIARESGCIPLLVRALEAKSNGTREAAAQAIATLITHPHAAREVKKDGKGVPNLVHLLDPGPQNTGKKYAVSCLLILSTSKKCKKTMISYGAIGYLKKLSDMDVAGAKKLLERLERGRLRGLFSRS